VSLPSMHSFGRNRSAQYRQSLQRHSLPCEWRKMVYDTVQDELNITYDETTDDGNFSLISVACLGCCSLAPVITINGEVFGRLDATKLRKILREAKKRAREIAAQNN